MAPRRWRVPPRNRLAIAAVVSLALHAIILAAVLITFPTETPQEPPPPTGVQVVFEPGEKASQAPKTHGPNAPERPAAPRGRQSPTPQRSAEASPPPAPAPQPPRPEPPTHRPPAPQPPKPVPEPKPVPPTPRPAPAPPKPPAPVPSAPKPPPALPKINLPPPPPPAPKQPKTPPVPVPAAVPLPSALTDNEQAEVNLNMPPLPELAPMNLPPPPPMPPPPPARPAPQRAIPARRSGHGRSSTFAQGMMMNGMSFSGGGGTGGQSSGLSMNLPSSMQVNSGSDLAVRGDPGTNWMAALEHWVNQRIDYPEMAGELGQQGSVTIRFTVNRAGHVIKLEMVTPTGYALLDQSWLGLFRNADLPPLTPDAKSDTVSVTATMHYQIVH